MRLREVVRIARRSVPGRGTPQLSLLGKGLVHHTYRVDRDGHSFSMRLVTPPSRPAERRKTLQNGAWVLRVLRLAADRTLAPPVVCADVEHGITVHSWVEGRAWPPSAVKTARNIDRFASLLRQVHALPVPLPARTSGPALWIRKYTAAIRALKPTAVPSLAGAADRQLARLAVLPGLPGVVCHSDLHRLNVLEYRPSAQTTAALLLLDWEYAHVSEPLWDLAGWSANNDFPDELKRRLLEAYLQRAPNEADWTRALLLGWLYDYVCLLWSEVYLYSRPRGAALEVLSRAAVLRARLLASTP